MLEMLYAGALRVSEIASVQLDDLKLEMGYVLVHGKGDKERIVPLGVPAQQALKAYLELGRPILAGQRTSSLLFIAARARRLTRQRIWQMVGGASNHAGRHASPHMLRHSCATHMVEQGADLAHPHIVVGVAEHEAADRRPAGIDQPGAQQQPGEDQKQAPAPVENLLQPVHNACRPRPCALARFAL